jgi:(S)-2-hydroxyglutarate dehydrogenase
MAAMDRLRPPPPEVDFVVVGGGILGLAVGRELLARHPDSRLAVVEAENRLAAHQTSHSSGVVHAGVYYEPGSLKARLCREGSTALMTYCDEHGIECRRTGKLIVATDESQLGRLDRLEQRARANGVPGLARVDEAGIRSIEPEARGLAALHSPETAVVDYGRVAEAFAAEIEQAGGSIHVSAPVIEASSGSSGQVFSTSRGTVRAGKAVFCAGLQADRMAALSGGDPEPRIVPIRGSYLKVLEHRSDLVRGNVYPVPDPDLPFLGAHLTRGFDGSLLIGPTAMLVAARDGYRLATLKRQDLRETVTWPGTWRLLSRFPAATARELFHSLSPRLLVREARRLIPALTPADVVPGPVGIRAQALGRDGRLIEDFLVEQSGGVLHVRNAPSPAATSSLALARLIADRID